MKNEITKRQKELLNFIYSFIETSGYPPTLEEMRGLLKISSNQAVLDLLDSLERKQFIKRDNIARGIVIRPIGYEVIGKDPLVKVTGVVAAGPAIQAIEQNEWVSMPSGYQRFENVFVIKISGNSMININIYDGDSVLIKESKEYKNGDIVLARIGDEVTVKRFVYDNGCTYLKPENPTYHKIAITHDTFFLGKMITKL